jgi:hypothetical protein
MGYKIYIGNVIDIKDEYDGCRVKAKILGADKRKTDDEIPYAFPLLPKHLQIKPKINEAVFVFLGHEYKEDGIRYYIGPIISQPQFLFKDPFAFGATTLIGNTGKKPSPSMSNNSQCDGVLPKDEEVALLGRKNSDIILGNDDLRIRCGVKSVNTNNTQLIAFNKQNPSFIKLKFHNNAIGGDNGRYMQSSATIVADEINLLSNYGNPHFEVYDRDEQITDDVMKEIVNKGHLLPYGDKLVEFLLLFLQMFKSHTHRYHNSPPCPDEASANLARAFGSNGGVYKEDDFKIVGGGVAKEEIVSKTFSGLNNDLLSKHIRIN